MQYARSLVLLLGAALLAGGLERAVAQAEEAAAMDNPFFSAWQTPFGAPPFDRIRTEHFLPAFERGMAEQQAEIDALVATPDPPSFANTMEALERSGELLGRVRDVLLNLNSAHTNEGIQAVVKEAAPRFSAHRDNILLDEGLFARVEAVWKQRESLDLGTEADRLLEETYKSFVRGGARLSAEDKSRLRQVNEELAQLTVQFGENLLKEMNAPALVLEDETDLAGLPEDVRSAAAAVAAELGLSGKWAFTLQRTSWTPLLQSAERRDLRERLFRAYQELCNRGNEHDNKALAARIAALRVRRAQLLGYDTHAHYVLEHNMAQTAARVYDLLQRIWKPALAKAELEAAALQAMIEAEGGDFELAPWDWWYYAEKVRAARYAFDEATVKPYLVLDRVRDGAFDVAGRLFGLRFVARPEVPVYHEDVRAFEVQDSDGRHLGLLYVDYFTRPSKRGGAWMNTYRDQQRRNGSEVRPIVANVCNFSKPAGEAPALLSLDEARTLFHEFGHALHGLLSDVSYESLSGTSVYRDFVELPSQMMENWAMHPEVLPTYARHHATGEPIPAELIAKLERAKRFNQGFETTEYVAASWLDMAWHGLASSEPREVPAFEAEVLEQLGLIPQISPRYRTTYFNHIFASGYAAGYYSYLWAEVLEADAFEAFAERGIFDRELARSYRQNILERGGSEPPMQLYVRFRGAEPTVEPLLRRRGLSAESPGGS